jgi:hypothetical protein
MIIPDEVVKPLLPQLYDHLGKPAMKEAGAALEAVVKAARFAIAPLEYLAAQHDRWLRYLNKLADEVPEDRLVEAHPQIAGPILSGLQYCDEEGILARMFVSLLARAIDRERLNEAHPAFAAIVAQLAPDEAVILCLLKSGRFHYRKRSASLPFSMGRRTLEATSEVEFATELIAFPDNIDLYVEHLHQLNLIAGGQLMEPASTVTVGAPVDPEAMRAPRPEYSFSAPVRLSAFGEMFARACVPDQWPSASTAPLNVKTTAMPAGPAGRRR